MRRIDATEDDELFDEKDEEEQPRERRRLHWLLRLLRLLIILSLVWFFGLGIFIDCYGRFDQAQHAQAIIVLGASVASNGKASDCLHARAVLAADLYKRGLAKKIICTGGLGEYPPTEAEAAAVVIEGQGVNAGDIILEPQSHTTLENARNAAIICRKQHWTHVILASEPFHLWRASRNFSAQGLTVYPCPASNSERCRKFRQRALWTARESLATTRDLCKDTGDWLWGHLTGATTPPGS